MDDRNLDELLDDVRASYRVPPAPDADAIWLAVEAEAFHPAHASNGWRPGNWRVAGMLAAACLVIGVFAGRWSAGATYPTQAASPLAVTPAAAVSAPYQQATEEVLGRAGVLLAALRTTDARGAVAGELTTQASRLLGTTRLLIDSPAAADPRMRNLLLDLELTLAQISRIQPARGETDLTLINDAVAERDMVPRIRSAVVDLSAGAY